MCWDASTEMLKQMEDAEQSEILQRKVRQMEFDCSLGPYPLATERQWRSLSAYISEEVLARANIPVGTLIVPGGIDDDDAAGAQLQPFFEGLARVPTYVQADPRKAQRKNGSMAPVHGMCGSELTRYHMDHSDFVITVLLSQYGQGGSAERAEGALLGELQLAFLLFLRLSSLRSLEQWKVMVHTLCNCEKLLLSRPGFFVKFLQVLRAQLHLVPGDFFGDDLSEGNFMLASLISLATRADGLDLVQELSSELARLWKFTRSRFGLELQHLLQEPLDDLPQVVYTGENGVP